jgi:hypothetical protein
VSAAQHTPGRLAMIRAKLQQQALHADTHGSNALANGNAARESGNAARAESYYAKSQYWLDRSNTLRDKIMGIDAALAKAQEAA